MAIHGPNVRRLITHKMSLLMVPPGGGAGSALATLTTPGALSSVAREATAWVEAAIAAVKAAPDNDHPDEESIAAEILRRVAAQNPSVCPTCSGSRYHSRIRGYFCPRCG